MTLAVTTDVTPLTAPRAPVPPGAVRGGDAELATRLRLVIARLARRLRQEAGPDVSPSMGSALSSIDRLGPLAPSELARIERVRRPTATRVLANLERAGLVVREPDPDDGRGVRVRASADGRRLLRRMRTRKRAYLARRLRGLAPEELATLQSAAAILEGMLEEAE